MKTVLIFALALTVLIIAASKILAQAPPTVDQASPPSVLSAMNPSTPSYTTALASPSITGTVKQYLLTPVGDVEGLELQGGTDVRFPPHMGAALAAIVKPRDRVDVLGFVTAPTAYGRAVKALTITNIATHQSVVDQPPAAPPPPPWLRGVSMRQMTLSGTLEHYILNDRGDIDGLILNNGYEVKFAPPVAMAAAIALAQQPSATIQASGYGTTNGFGTVVDAMTGSLIVGSQSIALAGPAGPPPPP
jgi:stage V sporulation protein SpoVS